MTQQISGKVVGFILASSAACFRVKRKQNH